MKKIIRKACFETNSSSTHSIAVARDDMEFVIDTIYPDQDGVITVHGQEFGWGWDKYNDSLTKLAYVLQDQGENENHRDMIIDVVKEQTGASEIIFYSNEGYIDHDGCGTAYYACKDKETLRQFIFNKNSWLFIGNDNSSPNPMFYDVPEFRDNKMISPRYKYELFIDGIKKTTKYKDEPTDEELADGIESLLENALLTESGHFIIDDSIHWQLTRHRGFYVRDWNIDQDYSTGEIRFMLENDPRIYQLKNSLEDSEEKYDVKRMKLTEMYLNEPGLVKKVKFTLTKL